MSLNPGRDLPSGCARDVLDHSVQAMFMFWERGQEGPGIIVTDLSCLVGSLSGPCHTYHNKIYTSGTKLPSGPFANKPPSEPP